MHCAIFVCILSTFAVYGSKVEKQPIVASSVSTTGYPGLLKPGRAYVITMKKKNIVVMDGLTQEAAYVIISMGSANNGFQIQPFLPPSYTPQDDTVVQHMAAELWRVRLGSPFILIHDVDHQRARLRIHDDKKDQGGLMYGGWPILLRKNIDHARGEITVYGMQGDVVFKLAEIRRLESQWSGATLAKLRVTDEFITMAKMHPGLEGLMVALTFAKSFSWEWNGHKWDLSDKVVVPDQTKQKIRNETIFKGWHSQ